MFDKDPGCLGVLILCLVWVVFFVSALISEIEWLIAAASVSIPAIPFGVFVGSLVGKVRSKKK